MNRPADETHPVRTHSVTYSSSRSQSTGSLTGITSEQLLFVDSGVGPLLHFQQHRIFMHLEAVAAAGHQHDVSRLDLAAGHQLPIIVVDVDLTTTAAHDDDLGRSDEMSFERTMDMTPDLASRRVDDEADLLFQFRRRQEGRLRRLDLPADDVSERLAAGRDVFHVAGHGVCAAI